MILLDRRKKMKRKQDTTKEEMPYDVIRLSTQSLPPSSLPPSTHHASLHLPLLVCTPDWLMAAFFKVCECTTAGLVKVGMMEYGIIFGLVGRATLSL